MALKGLVKGLTISSPRIVGAGVGRPRIGGRISMRTTTGKAPRMKAPHMTAGRTRTRTFRAPGMKLARTKLSQPKFKAVRVKRGSDRQSPKFQQPQAARFQRQSVKSPKGRRNYA